MMQHDWPAFAGELSAELRYAIPTGAPAAGGGMPGCDAASKAC